ncbi:hypothetical protein EJ110_NYTH33362 [Nymphaea thermarum]|nr:hypothetical protein EJ110_NYTH33362 [Nymphaea thermarum]
MPLSVVSCHHLSTSVVVPMLVAFLSYLPLGFCCYGYIVKNLVALRGFSKEGARHHSLQVYRPQRRRYSQIVPYKRGNIDITDDIFLNLDPERINRKTLLGEEKEREGAPPRLLDCRTGVGNGIRERQEGRKNSIP